MIIPSSLGVPNCKNPQQIRTTYDYSIEPSCGPDKITDLNSYGLKRDFADYTYLKNTPVQGVPYGWNGNNPKLMDAARGVRMLLDVPNYLGSLPVGDVCIDKIYTPEIDKYGGVYRNYTEMNNGNTRYYIDTATKDAYFKPVFVTPAVVGHEMVVDPMGVERTAYNRQSLVPYSWDACKPTDCLSSTHDQLEFRQELMEKQQRKMNEQRYPPRWGDSTWGLGVKSCEGFTSAPSNDVVTINPFTKKQVN